MDEEVKGVTVKTSSISLGSVWTVAWLFTIGYLHLDFWSGLFGILLWPYYLGLHFAG